MTEGFDENSTLGKLCRRMGKAFRKGIPSVRFTYEEKDILIYMYYESEMLNNEKKKTIRKVLDIRD